MKRPPSLQGRSSFRTRSGIFLNNVLGMKRSRIKSGMTCLRSGMTCLRSRMMGLRSGMMDLHKVKQKGFTLLEILVAIFIIGIIAVIMVRGLQIVLTTKDNLQRNETQMQQLNLTMSLMSGDMRNLINRSILQANAQSVPAVYMHDDATETLEFSRGSVSNPLAQHRSTVQRDAYQLKNGNLIRVTWPVLDQTTATQPTTRILLKNVTYIKWEFLGDDNRFYSGWPATGVNNQPLPKAVQVTLTIQNLGTIKRLFVVGNSVMTNNDQPYLKRV